MYVIAVDDEQIALSHMEKIFETIPEIAQVKTFLYPSKAVEWLQNNPIDVAFLDIRMRGVDGLALAKKVREIQPRCAIVFTTGYADYAMPAYKIHASGYLLKPITPEAVKTEIANIMNPPYYTEPVNGTVRAQCFGNFEFFIRGKPAKFRHSKSKELLAYLIDRRGAYCEHGEICAVLWEDRADDAGLRSQLRHLISDISNVLKEAGAQDALIKVRGMLAVVPENIDCDYYRMLSGDPRAVNRYAGEYMLQYSWAEMTTGRLGY